ncbi:uncharacterized protein LOC134441293 [Engraulis encrasicolus]|uniref:uncharacterized protein LOC134441293 n=1 Tax=Engraulis encrasicolus TaxID=184585 RepID=UPI002FD08032
MEDNVRYIDYQDRYILKLRYHLVTWDDKEQSTIGPLQRVKALVTNLSPIENGLLNREKLNVIAARMPTFYRHLTDAQYYAIHDDEIDWIKPKLRVIHKPFTPSQGDTDETKKQWKLFTGSNGPVCRPQRPNTTQPGRVGQSVAPPHIPPVALDMPWHPEGPETFDYEIPQETEYNYEVLPSGILIDEIFSLVGNSGGEEIPGLWKLTAYNPDKTVYVSAAVKILERKEKSVRRSSSRMRQPATTRKRRREAEAQDEDDSIFKRRRIYI